MMGVKLNYWLSKIFKSHWAFTFKGKRYSYFIHLYNKTWTNERAVEIPIIWDVVCRYQGKKILEVGNVLSNYFNVSHDVLDKYDLSPRVMREDAASFSFPSRYDLIVSISTLEHVGWDEKPQDPSKVMAALENLKKALNDGGQGVFTFPIGYNTYLDGLLKDKKLDLKEIYFLKRMTASNQWLQVARQDVEELKYGDPYNNANGLVIGVF